MDEHAPRINGEIQAKHLTPIACIRATALPTLHRSSEYALRTAMGKAPLAVGLAVPEEVALWRSLDVLPGSVQFSVAIDINRVRHARVLCPQLHRTDNQFLQMWPIPGVRPSERTSERQCRPLENRHGIGMFCGVCMANGGQRAQRSH